MCVSLLYCCILCCLRFLGFFTFVASLLSVLWYWWFGPLTCKTVSHITYTVLVETLNTAQSVNNVSDYCRYPGWQLQRWPGIRWSATGLWEPPSAGQEPRVRGRDGIPRGPRTRHNHRSQLRRGLLRDTQAYQASAANCWHLVPYVRFDLRTMP